MQLWLGFSGLASSQSPSSGTCSTQETQQQQQQVLTAATFPVSYSASYISAAAAAAAATVGSGSNTAPDAAASSSSAAAAAAGFRPPLAKPCKSLEPKPSACLLNLKELVIINFSRADGPWEPSVVLGDEVLMAVALGCPALQTLEVGVNNAAPMILALKRSMLWEFQWFSVLACPDSQI
jgi:hypothetical protein